MQGSRGVCILQNEPREQAPPSIQGRCTVVTSARRQPRHASRQLSRRPRKQPFRVTELGRHPSTLNIRQAEVIDALGGEEDVVVQLPRGPCLRETLGGGTLHSLDDLGIGRIEPAVVEDIVIFGDRLALCGSSRSPLVGGGCSMKDKVQTSRMDLLMTRLWGFEMIMLGDVGCLGRKLCI